MSEWKNSGDEINNAPEIHITERPHWGLPQMSYLNYEKKQWAPRSMDGLWFDAYTWRLYQQTRLTTIPMLSIKDVKSYYIDGSVGKFKWGI